MRILAIEPFHGGSHQAFLDGWRCNSQHEFTVIGLPAYKWKWRMRHAAVTCASQLRESPWNDQCWDILWCRDILNLAEFLGLAPPDILRLPRLVYFHENQLTYPVRCPDQRDLHFAFSNFTTALAADAVWFNSMFHRQQFLSEMQTFLARMPDYVPHRELASIEAKSSVQHPGVEVFPIRSNRLAGPLRILWNGRWEHDKNPEDFFAALRHIKSRQVPFRLFVLGESFRQTPQVFAAAHDEFAAEIEHWGFASTRDEYRRLLGQVDIVVSTALHEFFGIGVVEATAAGAVPLLPDRLAYPELLETMGLEVTEYVYDGSAEHLAQRLIATASEVEGPRWQEIAVPVQAAASVFSWSARAAAMDAMLDAFPRRG